MIVDNKSTRHISSYDDYDALMSRLTLQLTLFDEPRNTVDMEYDVGDENEHTRGAKTEKLEPIIWANTPLK